MSTYTMQEAFDTAWRGIVKQGFPAGANGDCWLRSGGNKCAIGHLILDEEYDPNMDNSVRIASLPIELTDIDTPLTKGQFLIDIQRAHDNASYSGTEFLSQFKNGMRRLATRWKLTAPIEDEQAK